MFKVSSNDVLKAVNVRDIERDKSILEVLNLAVSQEGYMIAEMRVVVVWLLAGEKYFCEILIYC